jgi:hypothetical protein
MLMLSKVAAFYSGSIWLFYNRISNMQQLINTTTGTFFISNNFSIVATTTPQDLLTYFGNETLQEGRRYKDYFNASVRNLCIANWYFNITFYFEKDRLTHFSFYPSNEPIGERSWEDFNPNADMLYMTAWMAQQMGDTQQFIWNLSIAGRQYHFPFGWGAAGVYYDFKDGSFLCTINYKKRMDI